MVEQTVPAFRMQYHGRQYDAIFDDRGCGACAFAESDYVFACSICSFLELENLSEWRRCRFVETAQKHSEE